MQPPRSRQHSVQILNGHNQIMLSLLFNVRVWSFPRWHILWQRTPCADHQQQWEGNFVSKGYGTKPSALTGWLPGEVHGYLDPAGNVLPFTGYHGYLLTSSASLILTFPQSTLLSLLLSHPLLTFLSCFQLQGGIYNLHFFPGSQVCLLLTAVPSLSLEWIISDVPCRSLICHHAFSSLYTL